MLYIQLYHNHYHNHYYLLPCNISNFITIVAENIISSEGALYVILPYDYQAAARPLFEHTPVLNNNLSINAMMTLLTMLKIMTEITKMKCQMTRNVK